MRKYTGFVIVSFILIRQNIHSAFNYILYFFNRCILDFNFFSVSSRIQLLQGSPCSSGLSCTAYTQEAQSGLTGKPHDFERKMAVTVGWEKESSKHIVSMYDVLKYQKIQLLNKGMQCKNNLCNINKKSTKQPAKYDEVGFPNLVWKG